MVPAHAAQPDEAEYDKTEEGEEYDENQEASSHYAEVIDPQTHRRGPQREQTQADRSQNQERANNPVVERNRIIDPYVGVETVHKTLVVVHIQLHLSLLLFFHCLYK